VFCIETTTLILFFLIFIFGCAIIYKNASPAHLYPVPIVQEQISQQSSILPRANFGFSKLPDDVLLNPYVPPMRDDRITTLDIRGPVVPINIKTQGSAADYRQIGILTRMNGSDTMLPLMGRPLLVRKDKWQFYTINEKNNFIKLPISVKGRNCTNENGCDNLYNGDTVYVDGYNDTFKVTTYENATMQYLPFL